MSQINTLSNNYDPVSWFYDWLSRVVFGSVLMDAQLIFLDNLPAEAHLLIAGGGTGQILEKISRKYPHGLTITYVELSGKMLALSRKRNVQNNRVTFIDGDISQIHFDDQFDAIITAFLFDNFGAALANKAFDNLDKSLRNGGLWLFTDFQNTRKLWHKLLLKSMYLYFRWLCKIDAKKLDPPDQLFAKANYRILEQETFYSGFIASRRMQKPE